MDSLHALGAAGPVAVVEVEAFALQNEGADTILDRCVSWRGAGRRMSELTRAVDTAGIAETGMLSFCDHLVHTIALK